MVGALMEVSVQLRKVSGNSMNCRLNCSQTACVFSKCTPASFNVDNKAAVNSEGRSIFMMGERYSGYGILFLTKSSLSPPPPFKHEYLNLVFQPP